MKKLTFNLPELDRIEINGEVFDILNKSAELTKKYAGLENEPDTPKKVELTRIGANEIIEFIDKILGEGAVAKISKSRPVNIVTVCNWLIAICGAIAKEKDEKTESYIAEKYE